MKAKLIIVLLSFALAFALVAFVVGAIYLSVPFVEGELLGGLTVGTVLCLVLAIRQDLKIV